MVAQNKKQMLYVLHICNFLQKSRGLPYLFTCEEYIHLSLFLIGLDFQSFLHALC